MPEEKYIADGIFDRIDFSVKGNLAAEYELCKFSNCNFKGIDLGNTIFIDCHFFDCDLSNAKISNTVLRDVQFEGCKMLGVHFEDCNTASFSAKFKNCTINFSSFYKMKFTYAFFEKCVLQEVDFSEADFTSTVFDQCDLDNAHFENTVIEKADFSTSFNYTIGPEKNLIKKARFSLEGVKGLLVKYNIIIE